MFLKIKENYFEGTVDGRKTQVHRLVSATFSWVMIFLDLLLLIFTIFILRSGGNNSVQTRLSTFNEVHNADLTHIEALKSLPIHMHISVYGLSEAECSPENVKATVEGELLVCCTSSHFVNSK